MAVTTEDGKNISLFSFWNIRRRHYTTRRIMSRKNLRTLRETLGYPTSSPQPSTSTHALPRASPPSSPEVPLRRLKANRRSSSVKRKANDPLITGSPKKPKQESPDTPLADDAPPQPVRRIVAFPERAAVVEERNGEIEFRVVNNDGGRESTIILTGLKCIFQKQLPKMPKDYIARLVYDRTHMSIAIVKKPLEVVGYVSQPTHPTLTGHTDNLTEA